MKTIIVIAFVLVGCEHRQSPESLKRKDIETAECIAACSPREMEDLATFFGCICKEAKK